jgi:hypothetical protein
MSADKESRSNTSKAGYWEEKIKWKAEEEAKKEKRTETKKEERLQWREKENAMFILCSCS